MSVIDVEPTTLMDASNVVEGETMDTNVFPEEELLPENVLNRYDDTSSPFLFFLIICCHLATLTISY